MACSYIYIYTYIYNIRTCKPFIYIYKLSICKWAVLHTRGVLLRSKKSSQVPDEFIRLQVSKWGSPSPRVDHALIWSISHLSWFTTNFPGWKSRIFPILRRLQRLVVQGPQKFIPQNFPIFEPHFRLGKLGDHFNIEDRWLVRLDELMRLLDCLGESLKWQVAMELWPPFHLNWSIIATMQRKLCFVRVKTFFFPGIFIFEKSSLDSNLRELEALKSSFWMRMSHVVREHPSFDFSSCLVTIVACLCTPRETERYQRSGAFDGRKDRINPDFRCHQVWCCNSYWHWVPHIWMSYMSYIYIFKKPNVFFFGWFPWNMACEKVTPGSGQTLWGSGAGTKPHRSDRRNMDHNINDRFENWWPPFLRVECGVNLLLIKCSFFTGILCCLKGLLNFSCCNNFCFFKASSQKKIAIFALERLESTSFQKDCNSCTQSNTWLKELDLSNENCFFKEKLHFSKRNQLISEKYSTCKRTCYIFQDQLCFLDKTLHANKQQAAYCAGILLPLSTFRNGFNTS